MLPRHQQALDSVVVAVRREFGADLAGLLLTGSAACGETDEHSDLDLYVLVDRPWRQRRTRWIAGVEVELFVNPVARIDDSLAGDVDLHCAHMFATGTALYDRDGDVTRLMDRARTVLGSGPPDLAPYAALMARYRPVDLLKDARDVMADAPACDAMIGLTLWVTLEAHYAIARRWWPKQKRVLSDLETWDAEAAGMARAVLDAAAPLPTRLDRLADLVERTLAPVGGPLHEWESEREPVSEAGRLL